MKEKVNADLLELKLLFVEIEIKLLFKLANKKKILKNLRHD
jgi:hypothetical protein